MDRIKILITGGNGYIAKSITNRLWEKYHILSPGREELDLLDSKSVDEFFEGKHFDIVIHTATLGGSRLKEEDETVSFYNLIMFYNLIIFTADSISTFIYNWDLIYFSDVF